MTTRASARWIRSAGVLLAVMLTPPPTRAGWGWGLRGGTLSTADGVNNNFGGNLGTLEIFGRYQEAGSKIGGELAVAGYGARRIETGSAIYNAGAGNAVSNYEWTQQLLALPVMATVEYGPRGPRGSLRGGAGIGLYVLSLQRRLSFANATAQARFGFSETRTALAAGPHLQVAGDYFFQRHIGVGFFGRYAFARWNESGYRGLLSADASGVGFLEGERLGNVAGLSWGAGLAVRF